MHFLIIALSLIALVAPLPALPPSKSDVFEELQEIPNGWTQAGAALHCSQQPLTHPNSRVLLLPLLRYSNFESPFVKRDRPNLSKWSLTCQLPVTQLTVNT
jgi:hypothetical protein